jgi:hypothetical protein
LAEAESLTERNEMRTWRVSMERCGRWIRTRDRESSSNDRAEREWLRERKAERPTTPLIPLPKYTPKKT